MSVSDHLPHQSSFHFVLSPTLTALGVAERRSIRSELIRRRCRERKRRYHQEQMTKLDKLLRSSSSPSVVTIPRRCRVEQDYTHSPTASESPSPCHDEETLIPESVESPFTNHVLDINRSPGSDSLSLASDTPAAYDAGSINSDPWTPMITIPPELYPVSLPSDISLLFKHCTCQHPMH
jgi:hypothetical protein